MKTWFKIKWVLFQWWVVNKLFADVRRKMKDERDSYAFQLNILNEDRDVLKKTNRKLRAENKEVLASNASIKKRCEFLTIENLQQVLEHPQFLRRVAGDVEQWMYQRVWKDLEPLKVQEEEAAYWAHSLAYAMVNELSKNTTAEVESRFNDFTGEKMVLTRFYVKPFSVHNQAVPYLGSIIGQRSANFS